MRIGTLIGQYRPRLLLSAVAALLLGWVLAPAAFAAQARANFDHLTTGFELIGQHRDLPCEACHANAVFKGTPKDCGACHGIGTVIRATAKPASHILSTDQCQACHTPIAWKPAVNFDHTQARGGCSTCHNNVQAQGKPPTHIVTDLECDACHTTLSWAGAVFTHQGITNNCASCHNGVAATGMPATHIPVGATPCEGCHSTTNFTTFAGTKINHLAVTALTCSSCHESANYLGMHPSTNTSAADSRPNATLDASHPKSGDCGQCHDTVTFAGSAVKPANHIPTSPPAFTGTPACTQCHTTAGNYKAYSVTATHQGAASCIACHGPSVAATFNVAITTQPGNHIPTGNLNCGSSGCHSTKNVNPGGFHLGAASISSPTLTVLGHTSVAAAVASCQTCHETAQYLGMLPISGSMAGDARPTAALDAKHPATGDCNGCHTTTPTFGTNLSKGGEPANHIPTSAPCAQCHTTAGNYALYSVTATHQGVTNCLSCHGPTVGPFANVTMVTTPGNHIPIGNLDCNGSGCHTTGNVNAGGFKLGNASINTPTLNVAGHTTIAAAVSSCQTCHATAGFLGMVPSGASAGDSRPSAALDAKHPAAGDCLTCHSTAPTFANDLTAGSKPANHIPTNAPCAQCHTTSGDYTVYSLTGTHQGVTTCLSCHGPTVGPFVNVTMVSTPANHIPIGTLDCNGSGCHTTTNVNPGGFKLGTANINSPTLNVAGHTTVAAAVSACNTCHTSATYLGMLASTNTTAGDSRPNATLDAKHPAAGDCGTCHLSSPTFATNASTKPANHIPTNAACAQCHTTPGNYAAYSVAGTHQGVAGCLICHGSTVAGTFANIKIVTNPANHFPFGGLDCNGSGCHTTGNVNAGGFKIGNANINTPTLTVAGHTTVKSAVAACQTCHETAPYVGMLASTATAGNDSRPQAFDKAHPTTGDCSGCHTTSPIFNTNQTAGSKPANHIPTSAPCAQCHTTAGNYAAYSVTGTHQGVAGCLICHGSTVAGTFANIKIVTNPANHFPFGGLNCNGSGCHTTTNVNAGGFKLGNASINTPTLTVAGHTTVKAAVAACQTCHETAPYVGMLASTATAGNDSRPQAFDKGHPATGDCGGCHTTTPTFSTNQSGGSAKPANHIPTNAPCAQCHTTAGNYVLYVMGATGHAGITNGCATCHAYGKSFYNMAPPTLKVPPSGATGHIPAVPPNGTASIACELCHSPAVFTAFSGTVMKHAYVTSMKCVSCHELGMTWKTNGKLWVRPSANHHAGQDCGGSGCHSSRDKLALRPQALTAAPAATKSGTPATVRASSGPSVRTGTSPAANPNAAPGSFNHASVAGTACVSCHSAASGAGKPAAHLASTDNCQSCHTTLAWLPVARVDHSQVKGSCSSCHNGTVAMGKPAGHVATSGDCASCHTTNAWTTVRFDHAAVAPHTCASCHNSVRAIGMPRTHIPTTQQCDACHGTLAWKPVRIDHTGLVSGCAACHNNGGAVGMPPGHMMTRIDCGICHSYPDWGALHFHHASAAYPGNHRVALACTSCHTSDTDKVPYPAPAEAGTCAACHTKDFTPAAHPKTVKGVNYTAHELANCSGACHVYSDTTQSTITRNLPGPRHRVTDATFKR